MQARSPLPPPCPTITGADSRNTMIRKSDLQWWLQEARKDPASAAAIIEELAGRLEELDRENEQLRDELVRLQTANSAGPVPASEELNALQAKVSTLQTILEGQASTEAAVVLISNQLQAARLPLSQVRLRLRDGRPALDRSAAMSLRCMLLARPQNDLLLLTSQGRAIRLMLHKVPFLVEQGDWPAVEGDQLATGERVTAAAVLGAPRAFGPWSPGKATPASSCTPTWNDWWSRARRWSAARIATTSRWPWWMATGAPCCWSPAGAKRSAFHNAPSPGRGWKRWRWKPTTR